MPEQAWQIAVDEHGEVRERRADQACSDRHCAHRRCWIEEAHVTELTGLLRDGPAGDQLDGWPEKMRIFARRERPHPGAQLTLFEAGDGWRYTLWVTNRPATTKGRQGQPAYIDATHRVHARVEDAIRTGKDCGIGKYPSTSLAMNKAWQAAALTAAALLARLNLLAPDGTLAKAEPKTLRYRILHAAAKLTRGAASAAATSPPPGPGPPTSSPPGTGSAPCHKPPDQRQAIPPTQGRSTRGPWNPRPPGPPAGPPSHPGPKSRSTTCRGSHPKAVTGHHESSGLSGKSLCHCGSTQSSIQSMKVSVSLPEEDVEFLDSYAQAQGIESRSAAVHKAVGLLRATQLGEAYEEAWDSWQGSHDADAWESAAADGLGT